MSPMTYRTNADLEREKNTARWRDWHHRNRQTYNLKRRLAARKRAALKRSSTKAIVVVPPVQQPSFYWTREYNPLLQPPRDLGWNQIAHDIMLHYVAPPQLRPSFY